ncbi:MAG TPA: hypothetical protein VHI95_18830 [Acidimicrobiales bacterium]|nr:hypothetical protein [Acidimicrobiales bacterium]
MGRRWGESTLVSRRTIGAVAGIAVVGLMLRVATVSRSIEIVDRLFISDDAYYTLTIARSIAHGHGPTTDGHTLTSGFQPLLGFLMVPVFWLTDNPDTALRVDLVLLVLVDTATIVVLAWLAYRLAGPVAAVAAAAMWAISPLAISMAAGGLETSLAIFLDVALVAVWIYAADRPTTRRWVVVGVVAGLTVLARVDALLLVGLLGALQLWRGPRHRLVPAAVGLAVVVVPWWAWCTVRLGTPVPTSGPAAHELLRRLAFSGETFARIAGTVTRGPFGLWPGLRSMLDDHPGYGVVVFWAAFAGFLASAWWWGRRRSGPVVAAAALPVFAAGLMLFYAWFGVYYYFVRYLAPAACVVTIVVAVAIGHLVDRAASHPRLALGLVALLAVAILVVAGRPTVHGFTTTTTSSDGFDALTGFRPDARAIVAAAPEGSTVGSWQSGAVGYYADGQITVVNLDGVVNPDAADAVRTNHTVEYVRDQHIEWLADAELILVKFYVDSRTQVRPPPSMNPVVRLAPTPQWFPQWYQLARIDWDGE